MKSKSSYQAKKALTPLWSKIYANGRNYSRTSKVKWLAAIWQTFMINEAITESMQESLFTMLCTIPIIQIDDYV